MKKAFVFLLSLTLIALSTNLVLARPITHEDDPAIIEIVARLEDDIRASISKSLSQVIGGGYETNAIPPCPNCGGSIHRHKYTTVTYIYDAITGKVIGTVNDVIYHTHCSSCECSS